MVPLSADKEILENKPIVTGLERRIATNTS
jgi:hypothetical protein